MVNSKVNLLWLAPQSRQKASPDQSGRAFKPIGGFALGYESPYTDQMLAMDAAAHSAFLDQMTQGMISRPEDRAKVKAWMAQADRKTFVYGYVDLLKLDSRPLLPSIQVPVLIIVAGQPFGQEALKTMEKQYERLGPKTFAFAAESKHYVMLDQPDWLVRECKAFLSQ